MNWQKWAHGLLAAVITGIASSVGAVGGMIATGQDHVDMAPLIGAVLGGALTGAVAYLKQSPLPPTQ